jgi:hypothetical protein
MSVDHCLALVHVLLLQLGESGVDGQRRSEHAVGRGEARIRVSADARHFGSLFSYWSRSQVQCLTNGAKCFRSLTKCLSKAFAVEPGTANSENPSEVCSNTRKRFMAHNLAKRGATESGSLEQSRSYSVARSTPAMRTLSHSANSQAALFDHLLD